MDALILGIDTVAVASTYLGLAVSLALLWLCCVMWRNGRVPGLWIVAVGCSAIFGGLMLIEWIYAPLGWISRELYSSLRKIGRIGLLLMVCGVVWDLIRKRG